VKALVAAEALKARTTRGPFLLLLAQLIVTGLGVAAVVGGDLLDPARRPAQLAQTVGFGLVFATILGILLVTTEFRHGTITPTLLVEPRRERLVGAKAIAGLGAGVLVGAASAALMVAVALPWLSARGEPLALGGDLTGAVVRIVAGFGLAAVLGVGVGLLVRSQVGAIVVTLGWFFVGEALLPLLGLLVDGDSGAATVNRYLPGSAFDGFLQGGEGDLLAMWPALGLVVGYVAALVLAGLALTMRRDVG
jgi:ABC-2 type transport system permease protein